jgi:hypothetical protein
MSSKKPTKYNRSVALQKGNALGCKVGLPDKCPRILVMKVVVPLVIDKRINK